MAIRFFVCTHCGNVVTKVKDSGVPVVCCGEKMKELVPGTTDAAAEKHVPVISQDGDKVTVSVGSVDHPMAETHYIEWVCLETDKGSQIKYLSPGEAPGAGFTLDGEEPIAAYAYCNLHGLWKSGQ